MTTPEIRDAVALLPCPWCGGTDINTKSVEVEKEGFRWYLECEGCGAMGPPKSFEPQRITAWNTRQAPAEPKVSREAADIALEAYNQGYRDACEDNEAAPDMELARDGWHDWLHDCEALKQDDLALSNPPADGDGWRPIETLPKDEKRFDLWVEHPGMNAGGMRRADCFWHNGVMVEDVDWDEDAEYEYVYGHGYVEAVENPVVKATHWMPVPGRPTPPSAPLGAGGEG